MAHEDCKHCDKLSPHAETLVVVIDEYDRQGKGGSLFPTTTMLKSMMESKLKGANPSARADLKKQLIEVAAAAIKLSEGV